jgi:transcriptional regulator with XRE-family HTH domain
MSVGSRVREARLRAGLTQAQLAEKAGMTKGAVSQLEIGESQSSTRLASIALALGVSAIWLQTGRGDLATVYTQAPTLPPSTLERVDLMERELLQLYRSATPAGRESIMAAAQSCEKRTP